MFNSFIFLCFFWITVDGVIREPSCKQEDNGPCDNGWKFFERPSGGWCMKVFYEDWIIQPEAEKRCQEQGATLSSFQNQFEVLYVTDTVAKHVHPQTGSVWFGYKRTEQCLNVARTANCTIYNSFEWTDKSATGIDGILWNAGQPANHGGKQNCVMLSAGYTGYLLGYQVGTFDDAECTVFYKGTPRDVRGYVCGKAPGC